MNTFMNKLFILLVFFLSVPSAFAAVKGETVRYQAGDIDLIGYIAYDDAVKGKRPGVILVPDWWGIGEFARNRADALAKLGYTAIVMDMYGNGKHVTGPATEASQLMNKFTSEPAVMKSRFLATRDTLNKHETVDSRHIAAIGYSLGGLVVLEMAREGMDLAGVASLWGVIGKSDSPAKKGRVKAKVLVINPSVDDWAPEEALNALSSEMKNAGAEYQLITYPNTIHGFSRPDADSKAKKDNLPIRYDAQADKQSWNDLSAFLKTALRE